MTFQELIDTIRGDMALAGHSLEDEVCIVCGTKQGNFEAEYDGVAHEINENGSTDLYFTKIINEEGKKPLSYEGNELYCHRCEHTWDIDNYNHEQVCPSCNATTDEGNKTTIMHNPFITCDCGARVYFVDDGVDIICNHCGSKYYDNGGQIEKIINEEE